MKVRVGKLCQNSVKKEGNENAPKNRQSKKHSSI